MRSLLAVSKAGRWIVVVGVVGAVGAATASAGSPSSRRPSAAATQRAVSGLRAPAFTARAKQKPKLGGVILGGVDNKSGFAHIIQVNRKLTRVAGWAGIELTCTSGAQPDIPDSFPALKLNRKGKFAATTGTVPVDTGDPHLTMTANDSVSGKINAKHTKATGHWQLVLDITDTTTGTPKTDHCDSGAVSWSAIQ